MSTSPRRVILAGGSGFLGQLLARHLASRGWEPLVLTRTPSPHASFKEVAWDARTLGKWSETLEGAAAVINLAGRSVNCRYTGENRRAIMDSRVESTRVIGEAIARCAKAPATWLNSGTATIYTHTFGPPHDETSADFASVPEAKDEFSVEVARRWEHVLNEASAPRTRKVALRITLVFGTVPGGVFQILRRLAKIGLGGRMGNGKQFVSWIHEEDFCRAVEWILQHDDLSGPINLAAPYPVTNAEMMQIFRSVCGLPMGLPASEWMLEVGALFLRTETELLLKSRRVVPGKLLAHSFQFQFSKMEDALRDLEGRLQTGNQSA
ncbi:MAG TPA: TIGR01777 family oxidoreductase [Methylomirabilota bacterium]|nr:TIGR01777 family oxidoreductase [Methylomirabilota bacterium]